MQGVKNPAIIGTEKDTFVFSQRKILTYSMEREIFVKGTRSLCVLVHTPRKITI